MYEIFKPESAHLRKYIREITVLDENEIFPKEYFAFPHNIGVIVFLQDAKINYKPNTLEINRTQTKGTSVFSVGKYIEPLFVRYKQYVNEVAINFTPTGINYFFDENFSDIAALPIQEISDPEINEFSKVLFNTNKEDRMDSLELFLEQRFREKNLQLVEQVIHMIEDDKSLKFKEICKELKVSERNLNRLFHKYMGCSPKDYKKIIRFRGAIKDYNKNFSNLTQICFENDYYDSPHFTKEFKRLTNKKPIDYFKHLTFISKNKYPYIFK
jgi:AraC-like DNA-binding protein